MIKTLPTSQVGIEKTEKDGLNYERDLKPMWTPWLCLQAESNHIRDLGSFGTTGPSPLPSQSSRALIGPKELPRSGPICIDVLRS